MKRLLLLLAIVVGLTAKAHATFTLTQAKTNNACAGSTTCTITVSSTGAGHSAVIAIVASISTTISSATGCSTAWTLIGTGVQAGNATTGFTDMAYCLSLTGSSTTIVVTTSNSSWNGVAAAWEVSSGASITFDTASKNLQSCTTSCVGTALTLGGTNDVIVTLAACGGTCSAITTYSADPASPWPTGDGMAHLLNTASGTAPTWTQSSSTALTSAAVALKDASGGGGTVTRGKAVIF